MQENAPRSDILNLLKRNDSPVDKLSSQLGISATATRQHLSILERDGLVKRTAVKEKIGRPKIFYSLTEKAEGHFSKAYYGILKEVLEDLIERYGPEEVRSMMGRLGMKHAAIIKQRLGDDWTEESLLKLLNEMGCYADIVKEEDHVLIKHFNCVLYDIARYFGDMVCEFNLQLFKTLFTVPVELTTTIANGDRYCSFVVYGTSVFEHAEEE
ncbi:MAG TPA: ArsR family transcriptional regulator [Desulfobacteria bacterium]|nr:ArsR family transcriptional regulator [Desulfobacteria bacterium]